MTTSSSRRAHRVIVPKVQANWVCFCKTTGIRWRFGISGRWISKHCVRRHVMTTAAASPGDRQWFIVGRWQEYEGEARANLLRIVAVGAFYVVELLRFYVFEKAAAEQL